MIDREIREALCEYLDNQYDKIVGGRMFLPEFGRQFFLRYGRENFS